MGADKEWGKRVFGCLPQSQFARRCRWCAVPSLLPHGESSCTATHRVSQTTSLHPLPSKPNPFPAHLPPQVGAAAMAGRWPFLLRHLSRYSARLVAMSDEQLVAMLKERLAPL